MKRFSGRVVKRYYAVHANHRRMARGAVLTALFVIVAKLAGAGREVAIAWRYGTGGVVDAYQLSLTITTWFPFLLAGVGTGLLVPRLVRSRRDGTANSRLVSELNGTILIVGVATTLGTAAILVPAVDLLGGGLTAETQARAQAISAQLLPVSFLTLLAGYFFVRLQACEHHFFSITDAAPALVLVAFVLAMPQRFETAPLVWGTLLGTLVQVAWLASMTRRNAGGFGGVRFRHGDPEWPNIYRDLLVLGTAQALVTLSIPIDQAFASRLGEGSIAIYGYANRVLGLLSAFGTIVIARALLPVLSGAAADGDYAAGRSQTMKWSLLLFGVGVAGAALLWVPAPWGIALLFERGAFTSEDSAAVAHVLRFGLVQLPFYFGSLAAVQWLAATGRYGILLRVAAAAIIVKIALNAILYQGLGLVGLVLATTAMHACTFALQFYYLRGKS